MMKECSQCKKIKPLFSFFRNKRGKDGYRANCKACQSEISKAWSQKNAEHLIQRLKEYRKRPEVLIRRAKVSRLWNRKNIASVLLTKAKKRAKLLGLPFSLTKDDILVPETCPVLNIPLVVTDGIIGDSSPTLDRIVPSIGYVVGNVAVISAKANRIKNNGNLEDLEKVCQWLKQKTTTTL